MNRGVCIIPWRRDGRYAVSRRTGGWWQQFHRSGGQGLWQFPGGKVEPGEDIIEAARREFGEETGLWVNTSRLVELCRGLPAVGYKGESFYRTAFGLELLPGEELVTVEPEKNTPWKWVVPYELRRLPMLKGTHELASLLWSKEAYAPNPGNPWPALCRHCGHPLIVSTSTTTGCCEYQAYRYLRRKFSVIGRVVTYLRRKYYEIAR